MSTQIIQILFSLGIILVTVLVAYLFNRIYSKMIRNSTRIMRNDPTNYKFLKHFIIATIYLVGISVAIYMVPSLKTLASSLLAGAGILAISVGFASQHALSNVISGLFIVIFKPFKVNDRLNIRTFQGTVEDITLRHTVIRDFENKRIVIPNTLISDEIIVNSDFAEEKICKWIDIGITYESDIDLAKKIMEDEVLKHPLHIDPRTPEQIQNNEPIVPVRVLNLAESSVVLRAWSWAHNAADGFTMSCDLYESIKKRFDAEGVQIAYPHRTVIIKQTQEPE